MKNLLRTFSIQFSLFMILLISLWVVYAAWDDPVSSWDPLSATSWNEVITRTSVFKVDSGNVWIWNIVPLHSLHIAEWWSNNADIIIDSPLTYNSQIRFAEAGAQKFKLEYRPASDDFKMWNLTIEADTGHIGIGNTNPSHLLAIGDDMWSISNNNAVTIWVSGTNNAQLFLGNDPDNFGNLYWDGGNDDLHIRTKSNGAPLNVSQIVLDASGNVWIWTTSPVQKLDVNGNIAVEWVTVHSSDKRLKKNIHNISSALDKVRNLRWVWYEWKDQRGETMQGVKLWVIAQELELILPEAVFTRDDELWLKSVDYNSIIPVLIEAIKEQDIQIDILRKEIQLLNNK